MVVVHDMAGADRPRRPEQRGLRRPERPRRSGERGLRRRPEPLRAAPCRVPVVESPPAGARLLERLRGSGRGRPAVDTSVVGELRTLLEEAAAPARTLPPPITVRVGKVRLRQVLTCEQHLVTSIARRPTITADMVRGRMCDHLFAQLVVAGAVGRDPTADALAAAEVTADHELIRAWESLSPDDREELAYSVPVLARELAARWPSLPPNALPRLQEPLRVELACGRVVLSGRVDVMLGCPSGDRVGTTLLDLKSGQPRFDDLHDARWYALLETLRHGAPPFQAGNYYLQDGSLALDLVTPEQLAHEAERIADGIGRLVRLAAGARATARPSALCPWCPALPSCTAGRRHVAEQRLGHPPPRQADGDDDADDDLEL